MAMKLIGSLTSPYVRKVRVVLTEKKLDFSLVEENVWAADTTIQQSNPLGKVPCLIMEDGGAVFDSRVIVEYVDTLSPVGKLIPANGRERVEVRTWEALADGICDAAIACRLDAARPAEKQDAGWQARQLGKIQAALKAMSAGLAEKPFCTGIHLTLGDVAVGCALGYLDFRFPHITWREDHANLARLMDKLMARASFAETAAPAA
jgi:glutathione S-transferase